MTDGVHGMAGAAPARGTAKVAFVVLGLGVIGWALCGATIGVGRAVTSLENTLVIHAILAPVFFGVLSWVYHRRYAFTAPLTTAAIWIGVVIGLDAGLVAPVFEGSYEMFTSFLGTWLPFMLIFLSSYLAGRFAVRP